MIDMSKENKKEISVNFKVAFDVGKLKILYHGEKDVSFILLPQKKKFYYCYSPQNWQN